MKGEDKFLVLVIVSFTLVMNVLCFLFVSLPLMDWYREDAKEQIAEYGYVRETSLSPVPLCHAFATIFGVLFPMYIYNEVCEQEECNT